MLFTNHEMVCCCNSVNDHNRITKLEIRSMERGICPIAVFYFALKRSFLTFKNVIGQQRHQCYQILGHMTSSVT